jgi:hypothetical protein
MISFGACMEGVSIFLLGMVSRGLEGIETSWYNLNQGSGKAVQNGIREAALQGGCHSSMLDVNTMQYKQAKKRDEATVTFNCRLYRESTLAVCFPGNIDGG